MVATIDHSARAHALLSASSSHRWLECTPSPVFEEKFEGTTSKFAEEGTFAHELAESELRHAFNLEVISVASVVENAIAKGFDVDEMARHAKDYADYIKAKVKDEYAIWAETRLDLTKWVPEGFGTADAILYQGKTLTVIDFKYGKGVEVSADHNTQMMLYGLGASELLSFLDIEEVEMCIFQPRIGNISEWSISLQDLQQWGDEVVIPKANMAMKGEGDFVPGEHCRFCKGKAKCRALMQFTETTISREFEELNDVSDLSNELSSQELGIIISKAPIIRSWLESVEAQALQSMLQGEKIEGYKLVETRTRRTINDEKGLITYLEEKGLGFDDIYDTKLKGLTALEKALGKDKKGLSQFCIKPKGAPTIAPISDKRDEYNVANDFDDITGGKE